MYFSIEMYMVLVLEAEEKDKLSLVFLNAVMLDCKMLFMKKKWLLEMTTGNAHRKGYQQYLKNDETS